MWSSSGRGLILDVVKFRTWLNFGQGPNQDVVNSKFDQFVDQGQFQT